MENIAHVQNTKANVNQVFNYREIHITCIILLFFYFIINFYMQQLFEDELKIHIHKSYELYNIILYS